MSSDSAYDSIAGMYHALWFDWYLPAAMPGLEKLFFSRVAKGAAVLDVCCGSGHVTKEFARRGYRVTGVDNSADLIQLAEQHVPEARFVVQNVCEMSLRERFDAAISTFDSLNHILTLEALGQAFQRVHEALKRDGIFVFDMNLHEAYAQDLSQWSVDIHDNSVGMVRGNYDAATRRARTELIWFARSATDRNCWQQKRSVVEQQCYTREAILEALAGAGFRDIQAWMADELGVNKDLGYGRMFVSAGA